MLEWFRELGYKIPIPYYKPKSAAV